MRFSQIVFFAVATLFAAPSFAAPAAIAFSPHIAPAVAPSAAPASDDIPSDIPGEDPSADPSLSVSTNILGGFGAAVWKRASDLSLHGFVESLESAAGAGWKRDNELDSRLFNGGMNGPMWKKRGGELEERLFNGGMNGPMWKREEELKA